MLRSNLRWYAVIPKDRFRGFACDSYARAMPNHRGTSRIPTSSGPLIWRGDDPCSTSSCSSDLHSCARTSATSASVIAGRAAPTWQPGRPRIPMPFLCPQRGSAVDFLCAPGPLWPSHEITPSNPVALARCRSSGVRRFGRWPDVRRSPGRVRRAADDPPGSGVRDCRDLAIVRDRLGSPDRRSPRGSSHARCHPDCGRSRSVRAGDRLCLCLREAVRSGPC